MQEVVLGVSGASAGSEPTAAAVWELSGHFLERKPDSLN